MSSYGEHLRVEAHGAVTSVTFAPARNPLMVLSCVVALCVVTPFFAEVRSGKIFVLHPFLVLFTALLASVLGATIWTLFGFWHTAIDAKMLTVTARVGPLQRRWSYPLMEVQNLRISERRTRGGFIRRIAFDYQGKRRYATPYLSRYEARVLIDGPFEELIR